MNARPYILHFAFSLKPAVRIQIVDSEGIIGAHAIAAYEEMKRVRNDMPPLSISELDSTSDSFVLSDTVVAQLAELEVEVEAHTVRSQEILKLTLKYLEEESQKETPRVAKLVDPQKHNKEYRYLSGTELVDLLKKLQEVRHFSLGVLLGDDPLASTLERVAVGIPFFV